MYNSYFRFLFSFSFVVMFDLTLPCVMIELIKTSTKINNFTLFFFCPLTFNNCVLCQNVQFINHYLYEHSFNKGASILPLSAILLLYVEMFCHSILSLCFSFYLICICFILLQPIFICLTRQIFYTDNFTFFTQKVNIICKKAYYVTVTIGTRIAYTSAVLKITTGFLWDSISSKSLSFGQYKAFLK